MIDLSRFTKGYLLVITSALVATLALFMPWAYPILWSSDKSGYGIIIPMLGIEFIYRGTLDALFIMSVIICMVSLWILAFRFYRHGSLKRFSDCYFIMGIGTYGLYALIILLYELNGYIGIGYILSGLAFLIILIGGYLNRNEYWKTHPEARLKLQANQNRQFIRSISAGDDPEDITTYPSTKEIVNSRRFSAAERKREYHRRGKSPSGVINGVYNDTFLEPGEIYNDFNRDWDADA